MIERMLTVRELARILNVPVSWVYARTRKGAGNSIPHVRVGKYIRFHEEAIRKYIEQRREPSR